VVDVASERLWETSFRLSEAEIGALAVVDANAAFPSRAALVTAD
jgi:hypothetical protein